MSITVVNGMKLYWELTGQAGNPLVLVHGSWGDHHGWDQVVPILARSFRVLSYDRRGHSQSERPTAQGSLREDVADLAALIEQLGLAPAHILGNSFGGSIVLRLATERPDLFRSMLVHEPPLFELIVDSAAQNAFQTFQERIGVVSQLLEKGECEAGARQFMETIALGPGTWEQLPEEARQTFIFNAATFLDELRDPECLKLDLYSLDNFSKPTLLTQGDQSELFFPLVLDEVARAIPQAQRRKLPRAGHVPQSSLPEEYVEVVTSFIRASDPLSI
jgi:pimeloyl-ACP methyl ester carboxylesterase